MGSASAAIVSIIMDWTGALRPLFSSVAAKGNTSTPELASVHHYIQTALGDPDAQELERILLDEDDPEHDTFLELLLFPDTPLRTLVEAACDAPLTSEEIVSIVRTLEEEAPRLRLLLDGTTQAHPSLSDDSMSAETHCEDTPEGRLIHLSVPAYLWDDIVRRLYLGADIGSELLELVNLNVTESIQIQVRMLLRLTSWLTGSRTPLTLLQRGYVYRFFLQYPASDPRYLDVLSIWLRELGLLPCGFSEQPASSAPSALRKPCERSRIVGMADNPFRLRTPDADGLHGMDSSAQRKKGFRLNTYALQHSLTGSLQDEYVWQHLVAYQRRLSKGIRDSHAFSEKLARYNMETLMMQGAQTAYINVEAAQEELVLVHRACLAILGRPAAEGEEAAELLMHICRPEPDVQGVLLGLEKLTTL